MSRNLSGKPDSGSAQSSATINFELSAAKENMVILRQLFFSTQIPVCLWFPAKHKNTDAKCSFRDRRQQTPFIQGGIRLATHPDRWLN